MKLRDLTGWRFGRLVVQERVKGLRAGRPRWFCCCDCGEMVTVDSQDLLRGDTKSCGCYRRALKDLAGQRFGRLLVLEQAENDNSEHVQWRCLCDCGNKKMVRGDALRSGEIASCGCLQRDMIARRATIHGRYADGKRPDYPEEWTEEFRQQVRRRDLFACQVCGMPEEDNGAALSVHHIDYDRDNTTMENCISLCVTCHTRTGHNREYWKQKLAMPGMGEGPGG